MADEFGIARSQLRLDEFDVALLKLRADLIATDGRLKHIHEMHGISCKLRGVEIERRCQNLEGKAGRGAIHALVLSGDVLVFLQALGLGVCLAQAFAVIDAHLGIEA